MGVQKYDRIDNVKKKIKNNQSIKWTIYGIFSSYLVILPATVSPFCQSRSLIPNVCLSTAFLAAGPTVGLIRYQSIDLSSSARNTHSYLFADFVRVNENGYGSLRVSRYANVSVCGVLPAVFTSASESHDPNFPPLFVLFVWGFFKHFFNHFVYIT